MMELSDRLVFLAMLLPLLYLSLGFCFALLRQIAQGRFDWREFIRLTFGHGILIAWPLISGIFSSSFKAGWKGDGQC